MKKVPLLILIGLSLTGCGSRSVPDLSAIYNRAAMHSEAERNPVILIPGILGSKLVDQESGDVIWGVFGKRDTNPEKERGAKLLALPMKKGAPLHELRDNIKPDGVLDRAKVNFFGLSIHARTYANIISVLGAGGYTDEDLGMSGVDYGEDHFTCFQFSYDFRRDVVEVAKELEVFILQKKAYVEEQLLKRFGIKKEVKFDLVAHSHGGNVARYYLRYGSRPLPKDDQLPTMTWAGAQNVERVIFVGPPNAGAVKAFKEVIHGRKIAPGLPKIPAAVAGTHPAVYQLMPRIRHKAVVDANDPTGTPLNIYDYKLWDKMGWGLADPKQDKILHWLLPDVSSKEERRSIALDHLSKSLGQAEQLMAALDAPSKNQPDHLKLILIAGDSEPTEAKMGVDLETGKVHVLERAPGDITVTRASALMDERIGHQWTPGLKSPINWYRVTFIFNDHVGLTKDPVFTDNVLYELLESQN